MAIPCVIQPVFFRNIDFVDTLFSLTTWPPNQQPTESLRQSISRVGILHPPIVRADNQHRFQVVAGRQRLLLAQEDETTPTCQCLVLPASVSEHQAFGVLMEETLASRPLTPIEQAVLLRKTADRLGKQQAAEFLLPSMGLPPNPIHIDRALELLQLEEPLQRGLHLGLLDETVARKMGRLGPEDRKGLFRIISLLKLSVGKQRKLINVCQELAGRLDKSITALLDSDDVRQIITHSGANPPQKAGNLMAWLARQYQPRLAEAEHAFRQFADGLGLPRNVALNHSPAFEQDRLTLVITLANRDELQKAWPALRPVLDAIRCR